MQLPVPAGDALRFQSRPIHPLLEPLADTQPGGIAGGAVMAVAAGIEPVLEGIHGGDVGDALEDAFEMLDAGTAGVGGGVIAAVVAGRGRER